MVITIIDREPFKCAIYLSLFQMKCYLVESFRPFWFICNWSIFLTNLVSSKVGFIVCTMGNFVKCFSPEMLISNTSPCFHFESIIIGCPFSLIFNGTKCLPHVYI